MEEGLDKDGLALALKEHLIPEIIELLKEQEMTESTFLSLDAETMKLFQFPLGYILKIMRVVNGVKGGQVVLRTPLTTYVTPSDTTSDTSASGSTNPDPNTNDNCSDKEDKILSEFVDDEYLKTLTPYLKISLCGKIARWRNLKTMNKSCGNAPDLGIPAKYLKSGHASSAKTAENVVRETNSDKHKSSNKRQSDVLNSSGSDLNSEHTSTSDHSEEDRGRKQQQRVVSIAAPPLLKTAEELKLISPCLPEYDIEAVLMDDENSKERTKHYVDILKEGKLLGSKERKRMFRKLGNYLCFTAVDDPSKATASMREGLAKSIVVKYPQYQKGIEVPNTTPWSHIWNSKGGHLVNIIKRIQTNLPDSKRAKKGKAPKTKKKKKMPTSTVDIEQLRLLLPNEANRLEIFDGMKKTFQIRCSLRDSGASLSSFLQEYEHFLHYDGELIAEEYKAMYPNSCDMCPELAKFVPKVIKNFDDLQVQTSCPDDNMKACLILAQELPHTIRSKSSTPLEEEIFVMVKTGICVESFVVERRSTMKKTVQPYILAVRSQMGKEILKYYIVLDNHLLDVGRIPFLRCIDWLFKVYVVFDFEYPKTWTQFFRFLQTCFYKIYFDGKNDIPPTSLELLNKLKSL